MIASNAKIRRGFTLVEMLVVIGIILLLIGILLPAINNGYRQATRIRMHADLVSIHTALEAYKTDHGDIPRTTTANTGAEVLLRALIAPLPAAQDGQDGNGFRVRAAIGGEQQGKVYGPYLAVDKFKFTTASPYMIQDRSGVRILYFPGNNTATITQPQGFAHAAGYSGGGRPMFNLSDNDLAVFDSGTGGTGGAKFRALLGARTDGSALEAQVTGEYLLWAAGPDGKLGVDGPAPNPNDPVSAAKARKDSDDVSYPSR